MKNLYAIAKYDTTGSGAWSALANHGLNLNGVNGTVDALAVSGSDLYVGGWFTQTKDGTVTNLNLIAKYNTGTNTWSALANDGLAFVNGTSVLALAVSGGGLVCRRRLHPDR